MSSEEASLIFGHNSNLRLSDFFCRLEKHVKLSSAAKEILLFAMGPPSYDAFCAFLRAFGPLDSCVSNAIRIIGADWFYGSISHDDAVRLLSEQKVGTFLVRFSQSARGCFALEAVIPDGESDRPYVLPIKVQCVADGFAIQESEAGQQVFQSLHGLLAHYKAYLMEPLDTTLPFEPWFHGEMSSGEATALLEDKPDGVFIVRFSSRPGCFATSFTENGVVCHALIHPVLSGGFAVEGDSKVYKKVSDVVSGFKEGLQRPLVCEENRRAQKILTLAKRECAKLLEEQQREDALFVIGGEEPDVPQSAPAPAGKLIYMSDGSSIKGGTWDALVDQLLENSASKFAKVFLITLESFSSKEQFLLELRHRYSGAAGRSVEEKKMRLRICNIVKQWFLRTLTAGGGSDLRLVTLSRKFIAEVATVDGQNLSTQLRQTLERCLRPRTVGNANVIFSSQPPPSEMPKKWHSVLDCSAREVARQLTLTEHGCFSSILPSELIGLAWTKKDKATNSPNLLRLIHNFNGISGWVARAVLTEPDLKRRSKVLEFFFSLAVECLNLLNFNSLMSIVAAIESSALFRLRKTKSRLPEKLVKKYDDAREKVAREGNFKKLREILASVSPPLIPYVGMYQSDLTFIEEGNKDFLGDGIINFQKRRLVGGIILTIEDFQSAVYHLQRQEKLAAMIEQHINTAVLSDDDAYKLSLQIEPRD